ncbi:hypothetical protein [Pedobacter kyonggii]|nr:hypothetical protein [Pedobacter kyonggii]
MKRAATSPESATAIEKHTQGRRGIVPEQNIRAMAGPTGTASKGHYIN